MPFEISLEKRGSFHCDRCFADGVDGGDDGYVDEEDCQRVGSVVQDLIRHGLREDSFRLRVVFDVDIGGYDICLGDGILIS